MNNPKTSKGIMFKYLLRFWYYMAKIFLTLLGIACLFMMLAPFYYAYKKGPYEEGVHWDYHIRCEEGFLWKYRSNQGAIPVLNSDGSHCKCGEKRH